MGKKVYTVIFEETIAIQSHLNHLLTHFAEFSLFSFIKYFIKKQTFTRVIVQLYQSTASLLPHKYRFILWISIIRLHKKEIVYSVMHDWH